MPMGRQNSMDLYLSQTMSLSTYVVGLQRMRFGEKNTMFETLSQNHDFRNCDSENFRILSIYNFYSKYL